MVAPLRLLSRLGELVIVVIVLVPPVHAGYQDQLPPPSQPSQQPTNSKPEKQPPPLFRKHRRGLYKNAQGIQVIDATPQSPPLEIDDPGVPDKGEYETNLTTHADFSGERRVFDFLFVDANYGVLPRLFGHELPTQVKFEFPVAAAKGPDHPFQVGIGAATFGLKLNFHNNERRGESVSVYPQIEFGFPGAASAEKGLAEKGQTLILPLLALKEFKYLTFVANSGIEIPLNDPDHDVTGTLGVGFGRAITSRMAAMGEIRFESAFDLRHERLAVVDFGLMRRLGDNLIFYTKIGHSIFSDDVSRHTYIGIGMKFTTAPK
jgi:hypothetical protein